MKFIRRWWIQIWSAGAAAMIIVGAVGGGRIYPWELVVSALASVAWSVLFGFSQQTGEKWKQIGGTWRALYERCSADRLQKDRSMWS
jgi:hypothetical protein